MDLFVSPKLTFVKLGSEVEMPEDPNAWPKEILQQLYKQVPYISDFEPHINMDRVDAERGYGFGHVEVSNQSEAQMGTPPDQLDAAGIREVRIPIIIREGKLQPFDVLVTDDSKMKPLTESRLRQAIFRPQQFDVTSKTPGDQSMIGQLYPPYRQNHGGGGGGVSIPEMGKTSSALEEWLEKEASATDEYFATSLKHGRLGKESMTVSANVGLDGEWDGEVKEASIPLMLPAILGTINTSDLNRFTEELEKSAELKAAYLANSANTVGALSTLMTIEAEKRASIIQDVRPTVTQVMKAPVGYVVKTANHNYWEPKLEELNRGEVVERYGTKIALDADTAGSVTMMEGEGVEEGDSDMAPEIAPVHEFGLYKVQSMDGKELIGYVIPNLLDVDGTPMPLSLFTNGSQSTVQADILGVPAGEGFELPTGDVPTGYGCFVSQNEQGIQATIPIDIQNSATTPEEPTTFSGETFDGSPIEVSVQPNIQVVMGTEDGKMLVPEHWKWLPLNQSDAVDLASSEEEAPKEASAQRALATVQVRCTGQDSFSVNGPLIDKLAHDEREFLSLDSTMFLLSGLGVKPDYAIQKLGEAYNGSAPVSVRVGRGIKLANAQRMESVKIASERMKQLPNLRRNLVKEAAVISDPIAVDAVLSLGFINPENLMTFISYIPTLEEAQSKMSELLIASRVGLQAVPEGALERAIRGTEEVLEGLKILAFQTPAA